MPQPCQQMMGGNCDRQANEGHQNHGDDSIAASMVEEAGGDAGSEDEHAGGTETPAGNSGGKMTKKEITESIGEMRCTVNSIRLRLDAAEYAARELAEPAATVESVYGKPLSEWTPPRGKVFTEEFRESDGTDFWMGKDGRCRNGPSYGPVLILREARRVVFVETGEGRQAYLGEYYTDRAGNLSSYWGTASTSDKYPIYRRVEEK